MNKQEVINELKQIQDNVESLRMECKFTQQKLRTIIKTLEENKDVNGE